MTRPEELTAPGRLIEALKERCIDLGLSGWQATDDGTLIEETYGEPILRAFMETRAMRAAVESCLKHWEFSGGTERRNITPGFHLIRMSVADTGVREGALLAICGEVGLKLQPEFVDLCGDCGVDPESIANALRMGATLRPDDPDRLCHVLDWSRTDLLDVEESVLASSELSEQLASTYEQISSIYRIGRSMNCLTEPELFIQSTCNQQRYLLNFEWLAVRYIESSLSIKGLKHDLIISGELPVDEAEFSKVAEELITSWKSDQWTHIGNPGDCSLATLTDTQILIEPITHDGVIVGAIMAGHKQGNDPEATSSDIQLIEAASDFLGVFHQNVFRYEVQRSMFLGTVRGLSAAIDAKDRYTRGHSERVAYLAAYLARATGMSEEEAERIHTSGLLHDIGKIGIPESVLCKPGRLTEEEFEIIKQHPIIGFEILKDIPPMADLLPGVLHHHEHWNGRGYPHGLAGEDIPIFGRIIAVADAFDAMSSNRAYRSRMSREKVLSILEEGAGSQWDPELITQFLMLDLTRFDEMIHEHEIEYGAAA